MVVLPEPLAPDTTMMGGDLTLDFVMQKNLQGQQ